MGKRHSHRNGEALIALQKEFEAVGFRTFRKDGYLLGTYAGFKPMLDAMVMISALKEVKYFIASCWVYPNDPK